MLCFGGSFNPIHHGHLICARAVAEAAGFSKIMLIPSAQPPHKPNTEMASAEHRLAMCRAAASLQPELFEVDDLELTRATPSYTLDTVRELKRRGRGEVQWLIGADMLLYLPQWHRPLELLAEVKFLVMARPGYRIDWEQMPAEYQFLQQNVVEAPLLEISATDIRRRVRGGDSITYLVPRGVEEYIREFKLYR